MFIDFRESEGEKEREERRESGGGRGKHLMGASHMYPDQGLKLQPRNVPWPGIEPLTFLV